MNFLRIRLLFPEWGVLGILLLLLIASIAKPSRHLSSSKDIRAYGMISLLGAAVLYIFMRFFSYKTGLAFQGLYSADAFSYFFKGFFLLTLGAIVPMTAVYFFTGLKRIENFLLILWCAVMGMFFLVSAHDLFMLFIALEIVTMSFYILASYSKHSLPSIEAGLKYLIMGSLASAFMLFGIALFYFKTGVTNFDSARDAVMAHAHDPAVLGALLLMLAGAGFKIAAVPFQFWVPDVYEGAPTPTVAFLSVGSKAAGFVALIRILFSVFKPVHETIVPLLSLLAAATLLYGNLGAIQQKNIKRLMGYSSIGHAGYLLIGLAVGYTVGITSTLYYLIAYAFSSLTIFLVIVLVYRDAPSDGISHLRGLSKRSPFLAACLFISLLSLAGVPGTAGFFGKFLVLLAAVRAGIMWLVLLGVLGVVISLYYYLKLVRAAYIEEASDDSPIEVTASYRFLLGLLVMGILAAGLFPSPFLRWAAQAASSFIFVS